jgi:hypothetical protein
MQYPHEGGAGAGGVGAGGVGRIGDGDFPSPQPTQDMKTTMIVERAAMPHKARINKK